MTGRGNCCRKSMLMLRLRYIVVTEVGIGVKVLLSNLKTNKLSPNYDPNPCDVVTRKKGEVTGRSKADVDIKRNVPLVKKYQ